MTELKGRLATADFPNRVTRIFYTAIVGRFAFLPPNITKKVRTRKWNRLRCETPILPHKLL